jgi:hypothetical protein
MYDVSDAASLMKQIDELRGLFSILENAVATFAAVVSA